MGEEVTTTASNLQYLNYIAFHIIEKDMLTSNNKKQSYE